MNQSIIKLNAAVIMAIIGFYVAPESYRYFIGFLAGLLVMAGVTLIAIEHIKEIIDE